MPPDKRKPPLVVLDTCVLYPMILRDTLLRLAERRLYRPRWSRDTLVELDRNLARSAGMPQRSIDRLLERMDSSFPLAVLSEYDHLIPSMSCHVDDRHVLAAAVQCGAATIVTFNTRDFPAESTSPHRVRVLHPDDFLLRLLRRSPIGVLDELDRQAAAYRHDPRTLPRLLEALAVKVRRFAAEAGRSSRRAMRTYEYRTGVTEVTIPAPAA